jgi:hypothetical protein
MRAEDGGGSECRPVTGRIGVEAMSRHHPARKRTDFRRVLHHENGCDTSRGAAQRSAPRRTRAPARLSNGGARTGPTAIDG